MVDAIHAAGMEVILDVAYNHTGESNEFGPTLSLRGIDNLSYYRTHPENAGAYINDTGCGNTLNADHPVVQTLVLDSLRYWHRQMGVDGFRFDLATVLGSWPGRILWQPSVVAENQHRCGAAECETDCRALGSRPGGLSTG